LTRVRKPPFAPQTHLQRSRQANRLLGLHRRLAGTALGTRKAREIGRKLAKPSLSLPLAMQRGAYQQCQALARTHTHTPCFQNHPMDVAAQFPIFFHEKKVASSPLRNAGTRRNLATRESLANIHPVHLSLLGAASNHQHARPRSRARSETS
jgi:hypothetical protein